ATINGMLTDPSQYYFNIHTTQYPAGVIRGQLQAAIGTFLIGSMTSADEVPNPNVPASGTAVGVGLATLGSGLLVTSGSVYMQTSYNVTDTGTFTGFHIHPGVAGTTGPAALSSGIPAGTPIATSGSGSVGPFYFELDPNNAVQLSTFANLFLNP